jgi:hypothetical protein
MLRGCWPRVSIAVPSQALPACRDRALGERRDTPGVRFASGIELLAEARPTRKRVETGRAATARGKAAGKLQV